MSLKNRTEEVTDAVVELLGSAESEQREEIAKIIEKALINSYRDCTERNTRVATACCEGDRDKAHKISEEMHRANTALIANLSAMR